MSEQRELTSISHNENVVAGDIQKWEIENQNLLVIKLEEERQALLHSHLTNIRWRQLQVTDRLLSEMDLCDAWKREISLPTGFQIITGRVQEPGEPNRYAIRHTYARDTNGIIICITPGQFVEPFSKLPPGRRIEMLQERAPELVRVYPGGLAVLSGSVQNIASRLNLVYRPAIAF